MKKCPRCSEEKTLDTFGVDNRAKDGKYYLCRECSRQEVKNRPSRSSIARREAHFRQKYGITLEEYKDLFDEQNGSCAICATTEPGGRYNVFHVDHNHDTGEIRGLLCSQCNHALGLFKDSIDILHCAVVYLRRVNGNK